MATQQLMIDFGDGREERLDAYEALQTLRRKKQMTKGDVFDLKKVRAGDVFMMEQGTQVEITGIDDDVYSYRYPNDAKQTVFALPGKNLTALLKATTCVKSKKKVSK